MPSRLIPQFAVIGLGRFGSRLARELTRSGAEVIAIDQDVKVVEDMRDDVTLAVRLDATDEDALRHHGVDKVDAAVVGIGTDFESACLTVSMLKMLGIPRIICRAQTQVRARILQNIGAGEIVNPEGEAALRWSHRLMLPKLHDYVELDETHSIVQILSPAAFHHKSPMELRLRQKFGVNLVAIKRTLAVDRGDASNPVQTPVVLMPEADQPIMPNDLLILVGSNESLSKIRSDRQGSR